MRTIYYNVEILALPHRWFNDYRSLANVWLPALVVMALAPGRSRAGFYACAAVLTQVLLRLNTSEAGAMFDRIQHMLPLLAGPALAGFVLRFGGTRKLAVALVARDRRCTSRPRSCRCATCPSCARSIRR